MNKINKLFSEQKVTGKKILSLYFCAGCPTLEGTAEVIKTLEKPVLGICVGMQAGRRSGDPDRRNRGFEERYDIDETV